MDLRERVLRTCRIGIDKGYSFRLLDPKSLRMISDGDSTFAFRNYQDSLLKYVNKPPEKRANDPLVPPFDEGIFIAKRENHNLLVNKFAMSLPHIVISAADADKQQGEPLGDSDFAVLSQLFDSFPQGIGYYNAGIESGCTQLHHHLQFIDGFTAPLLEDYQKGLLPFLNYTTPLTTTSAKEIAKAYDKLMNQMGDVKGYNFAVLKKTAILVPRQAARHATGVVVNTLGVLGNFAVWSWSDPKIEQSPLSILTDLCIRKNNRTVYQNGHHPL